MFDVIFLLGNIFDVTFLNYFLDDMVAELVVNQPPQVIRIPVHDCVTQPRLVLQFQNLK